jgi:hypothetical protein
MDFFGVAHFKWGENPPIKPSGEAVALVWHGFQRFSPLSPLFYYLGNAFERARTWMEVSKKWEVKEVKFLPK